jgi:hypothetical protein
MNLSQRSKLSLCQFLRLFDRDDVVLLLKKHGLSTEGLEQGRRSSSVAAAVKGAVLSGSTSQLGDLIQELVRTRDSMRTSVSPRYCFDERWNDLRLCLELDSYALARDEYGRALDHFVPIEPMIEGAEPVEDDLVKELQLSGLPESEAILRVLDDSANAFRRADHNGCLNNARVALQALAKSIGRARLAAYPGHFDDKKWGQTIAYLRSSSFITQQQEEGLTGVFSFVSPGSHTPMGFSEQEFARLGRTLAVSCCYFLAKLWNASNR